MCSVVGGGSMCSGVAVCVVGGGSMCSGVVASQPMRIMGTK